MTGLEDHKPDSPGSQKESWKKMIVPGQPLPTARRAASKDDTLDVDPIDKKEITSKKSKKKHHKPVHGIYESEEIKQFSDPFHPKNPDNKHMEQVESTWEDLCGG